MKKTLVNLKNADRPNDASDRYKKIIEKITNDGVCPFCQENLVKFHKNPIILENDNWLATDNMFPYKGAAFHILLIHKTHISSINEMEKSSWEDLREIINLLIEKRGIAGGSLFLRFGDTEMTGATVTHLHAHIISSSKDNKEPILVRVG